MDRTPRRLLAAIMTGLAVMLICIITNIAGIVIITSHTRPDRRVPSTPALPATTTYTTTYTMPSGCPPSPSQDW